VSILLKAAQFLDDEYTSFVVSAYLGHFGFEQFVFALLDILNEQVPPS